MSTSETSKPLQSAQVCVDPSTFGGSSSACIENAKRLLEDGEWCSNRPSTGLALVMLAQEECAKGFVLILVRDQIIPWSNDLRKSLYNHHCKYVLLIVMEWLARKHQNRESAWLKSEPQPPAGDLSIPCEVAKAMNIYRHEMLEDQSNNLDPRRAEWNGIARKAARGKTDRRKQNALYIGIGQHGQVTTKAPTSTSEFEKELIKAKEIIAFTETIRSWMPFDFPEYARFTEVFGSMFRDLAPGFDRTSIEEHFPSEIPGIGLVRTQITIAGIESGDGGGNPINSPSDVT